MPPTGFLWIGKHPMALRQVFMALPAFVWAGFRGCSLHSPLERGGQGFFATLNPGQQGEGKRASSCGKGVSQPTGKPETPQRQGSLPQNCGSSARSIGLTKIQQTLSVESILDLSPGNRQSPAIPALETKVAGATKVHPKELDGRRESTNDG